MTEDENHVSIEEYKIKASILLKALRSNDASTSTQAAKRFGCLVEFENRPWSEIKTSAKRKHALAVIAIEHGYDSWTALKNSLESDLSGTFVSHYKGGFLNKWFATYETAKIEQQASGGFLLPYKKQFFVCEASGCGSVTM